jgi:flagellar protein FlbD
VIPIHLLSGAELYINAELVESVAAVPDTIITLTSGRKIVARTRPEEICQAMLDYRRRVHQAPRLDSPTDGAMEAH